MAAGILAPVGGNLRQNNLQPYLVLNFLMLYREFRKELKKRFSVCLSFFEALANRDCRF